MKNNSKSEPWLVLVAVYIAGISLAWSQNKIIPIISDIMDNISINMTMAGWLSSVFCIMGIVMALPTTKILKKLGAKKTLVLALIFTIAGSALGVVVSTLPLLMLSRVIEGIGVGIISVAAPAIIAMWFPASKRGLPMGIWGSWQMVAQGSNFFLAVILTEAFGYRGMWHFGIALAVIAMVCCLILVTDPRKEVVKSKPEMEKVDLEKLELINENSFSILSGLKSKSAWQLSIGGFFFCFVYFGWVTWIAPYWVKTFDWTIGTANKYLGYMCLLEIPVVFVLGYILDKVKNRKTVGLISCIFFFILIFISFKIKNPAMVLPFIIIYPIVEGGIPTLLFTIASQTVKNPADSGTALALLSMGMNLGTVIGAPIIGAVIERGGYNASTICLCVAILILTICIMKVRLFSENPN